MQVSFVPLTFHFPVSGAGTGVGGAVGGGEVGDFVGGTGVVVGTWVVVFGSTVVTTVVGLVQLVDSFLTVFIESITKVGKTGSVFAISAARK